MPRRRAARAVPFGILACFSIFAIAMSPTRTRCDDSVLAPYLVGTYPITGTFGDGKSYTGTIEIKKRKTVSMRKGPSYDLWALHFHYSTGWDVVGMRLWRGNRL